MDFHKSYGIHPLPVYTFPPDTIPGFCSTNGTSRLYIPFVNAITRSGTMEEKDMVFKGMLTQYAFDNYFNNEWKKTKKVIMKEKKIEAKEEVNSRKKKNTKKVK